MSDYIIDATSVLVNDNNRQIIADIASNLQCKL